MNSSESKDSAAIRLPKTTRPVSADSPIGPVLSQRSLWIRYSAALLTIGLVTVLRFAAVPIMGAQAPLLPFGFAVFAAAYLGGLGPALAATCLASLASTALYANLSDPDDALAWAGHVALFTTLGFLVAFMMHRLQQSYCIQRDALAAAKAREEQLQTITDAMPALIAYVDDHHRFRFNNKGYQEWFALSRDELLGKHAREVLGEDVYRQLMPRIETALSGMPVSFETEIPYLAAGTRHVSVHYVPDRSSDGTIRGYFALIQDISDRIHKEQLLADAKLRLSIAMRVGRSGAFEWDIEKQMNTWSEELLELHGLQPGEFKGTNEAWLECIHPDDVQRVLATAERALKEGETDVEYRIRRRDTGETRWLQGRGKVFYDAAHNPVRMVGINVDVTERKRAEEALREADRRKDEFIAMLAHELRNPLAPIRNVAHILGDQNADVGTVRQCGRLVQRQVTTLTRLVDDLLDVARMRNGRIEIKSERVDLATIIERAIETMQSPFDARDQVVVFLRPPVRAWVHGDPVRLEQVFTNLLANASKFSGPYTRVEIKVELAGDTVLARVRDQGSGIDAQLLPHVFELFTQGDQSLDRPTAGLGIGLALVKSVVGLHGGSVEARSEGLGLGSEFVVSLPMSEAAEELQDSRKTEHGHVRRRVLIIEDNADSAESLRILLRLAGHEVVSTNQAFTALEALESFVPEWILTDIGLPGLDGYSLATMIRNHPNGRTAQLYAVTGYGRAQDRELALQSGFDGHLTKPVDPTVLLSLLDADSVKNDATSNESNAGH